MTDERPLASNAHFVATRIASGEEKCVVTIESATQKNEAMRNAKDIVMAMKDIQEAVLAAANCENISLIIDVCYLSNLVGVAGRLPEFGELNQLAKRFDLIVNYSSEKSISMSVIMQLINLLSMRAPNVKTAPNYDTALTMVNNRK